MKRRPNLVPSVEERDRSPKDFPYEASCTGKDGRTRRVRITRAEMEELVRRGAATTEGVA